MCETWPPTVGAMKVLLTGASGLLGTWLRRTAPAGVGVVSVVHRTARRRARASGADLRAPDRVTAALAGTRPDLVVHAAYAKDEASIVDATRNVVSAAAAAGADLVHISTEAVFSGDGTVRDESAPPDPVWDYGRWKAEAETIAAAAGAAIVRLPLIISADPEDHIIADLRAAASTGVPRSGSPTRCASPPTPSTSPGPSGPSPRVPADGRAGVWHLPGPEVLSRLDIADRAVAALGLDPALNAAAPTPAHLRRPRDIRMGCARAVAAFGWAPSPVHAGGHPDADVGAL